MRVVCLEVLATIGGSTWADLFLKHGGKASCMDGTSRGKAHAILTLGTLCLSLLTPGRHAMCSPHWLIDCRWQCVVTRWAAIGSAYWLADSHSQSIIPAKTIFKQSSCRLPLTCGCLWLRHTHMRLEMLDIWAKKLFSEEWHTRRE